MNKLKSRRFWIALLGQIAGGYLISQGQAEAGAAVIGITGGSYSIGQSLEDAAKAKAGGIVRDAILNFEKSQQIEG